MRLPRRFVRKDEMRLPRRKTPRNDRWLPAMTCLFMLAVGILLNLIIPPFQNPDEPQHFGMIMIYTQGEENQDAVERGIVQDMDRNLWWNFLGIPRSDPMPNKLSDIDFLMRYQKVDDFKRWFQGITIYHRFMGKLIKIAGINNVTKAYYMCRVFSYFLFLCSLFLMYLTFNKMGIRENGKAPYFLVGFFLILFLPQFNVLSLSVSPDSLSLFLCSVFLFSAFSMLQGKFNIAHLLLVVFAALGGFVLDRSTFFLLPLGLLLPFFLIKKKDYKKQIVFFLGFIVVLLLLVNFLVQLFPLQIENNFNLIYGNIKRIPMGIQKLFSGNEFNREFFALLSDTFFFKFGWNAFVPNKIFYSIWRVITLLSLMGILLFFGKFLYKGIKKQFDHFWSTRIFKITLFSTAAIFIQFLAVWTFYGSHNILAQGRHFYPVILPLALLLLVGLKALFDLIHKKGGIIAVWTVLLFEFVFFNFAVWNYLVPVFHLTVKSAHPGI